MAVAPKRATALAKRIQRKIAGNAIDAYDALVALGAASLLDPPDTGRQLAAGKAQQDSSDQKTLFTLPCITLTWHFDSKLIVDTLQSCHAAIHAGGLVQM